MLRSLELIPVSNHSCLSRNGHISHFEPTDGWKLGPMTPEKERMKELCKPVFEWVKTMK